MSVEIGALLREVLPAERIQHEAPLAPFTTFRVGGPAEWLVLAASAADVRSAVAVARRAGVPVVVLGGGSNVLVSERGVRGIVIRVHGGEVTAAGSDRVRADAGVTINGLVRWTIHHGFAGLEAWAGTPGTVGGAIRGNAHFKGRNIGEYVARVELLSPAGDIVEVAGSEMAFAYDQSRIQHTGEIVLSAEFIAGRGDPAALRAVARESLAFRKRTQPLESASAGCIFQNPDPARDAVPAGMPCSAGALVDRAGLKGASEGGAHVSTTHANFVVNDGTATAADIRRLIDRCRHAVREQFGVELKEEIVSLGFREGDDPEKAEPDGTSQD